MSLKPILISERAAEEVKLILQSDEIPNDHCLRIGVKDEGCGTGGYSIGFDTKRETDMQYSCHGIDILVEKKHVMYLLGMEVNYREEDDKWGFVFDKVKEDASSKK